MDKHQSVKRWIFFDLGWTLVDETEAHRNRWEIASQVLSTWGILFSVNHLMQLSEQTATDFAVSPFRSAMTKLDLTNRQREAILSKASYVRDYDSPYPEVPALLEELSKIYKIGVIANQPLGTEVRLKKWGIYKYISLVIASAEAELTKPDPKIFQIALNEAGCAPDEAIFVGDRLENDIGPANRLGMQTIRIRQGFHRFQEPRQKDEVPDFTIDTIVELPEAIEQLSRIKKAQL